MAWAPQYLTVDEAREFLRIDDLDDDAQIVVAIESASRAIDYFCNRQFGAVAAAEERTYIARADYSTGYWALDIDDLATTTNLVVTVDGTPVTEYDLSPLNAVQTGRVWTTLHFNADSEATPCSGARVAVEAVWGWPEVPERVKQACLLQVNRLLKRRDSPLGVAGDPTLGSELRLLNRLDPDVTVTLRGLTRVRAVG